jgi:hypothetical protein
MALNLIGTVGTDDFTCPDFVTRQSICLQPGYLHHIFWLIHDDLFHHLNIPQPARTFFSPIKCPPFTDLL